MQYTQPSFTVAATNGKLSQKEWDRAFLSEDAFRTKYKEYVLTKAHDLDFPDFPAPCDGSGVAYYPV